MKIIMVLSEIKNKEEINTVAHHAVDELLSITKYTTVKDFKELATSIVEISEKCVIAKDVFH